MSTEDRTGQVLADIDDVITGWNGSRDSMRWSPGPQSPTSGPVVVDLQPLIEALQRACVRFSEAFRPLAELMDSPGGLARLAAAEANGADPATGCHCLCGKNHPGEALCLGEVRWSETCTVRFGSVDVPMCEPCAERTGQ